MLPEEANVAKVPGSGDGEVVVRPRTTADIQQAAAVLVAVHTSDGYPVEGVEDPEQWLCPEGTLGAWVALADGRVIGHAVVARPAGEDAVGIWAERSGESEEGIGVLARLFVLREARKRSAGELLVRAAEDFALSRGMRLVLDVMVKDAAAIRLYERLGWREIGRVVHRFGAADAVDALAFVGAERRGRNEDGA